MIISHKYKFIYIKATKVAGTSVEVALAKYCGDNDIITKIVGYSKESDHDKYDNSGKNSNGLKPHTTPTKIQKIVPKKMWDSYYKFTIVRNPWDMAISKYFYNISTDKKDKKNNRSNIIFKKIIKNILKPSYYLKIFKILKIRKNPKDVNYFLKTFSKRLTNSKYYFDKKGNPFCDFYIRFENLEEDYRKVCEHLGIPYEKLPRLKTKQRTEKKHYSVYYDEKSKKHIAKICKREIEYFNYKFEEL